MKRIKTMIESFLNIGRDPVGDARESWAGVRDYLKGTNVNGDHVRTIDRIVDAFIAAAGEHKAKAARAAAQEEST